MNTALATQNGQRVAGGTDEQSLILPNKREVLLMRLGEFKVSNLSARDHEDYKKLAQVSTGLFVNLCWSKLDVRKEQLKKLEQHDLNELATMLYEQSRATAIVHTSILTCIPVIGWIILVIALDHVFTLQDWSWTNMRYYWYCKRIKNKYGKDFEPIIDKPIVQERK